MFFGSHCHGLVVRAKSWCVCSLDEGCPGTGFRRFGIALQHGPLCPASPDVSGSWDDDSIGARHPAVDVTTVNQSTTEPARPLVILLGGHCHRWAHLTLIARGGLGDLAGRDSQGTPLGLLECDSSNRSWS